MSKIKCNAIINKADNSEILVEKIANIDTVKADIELDNVDNTSDANKPISTAQQNAIDTKVDKVSGKSLSANDFTDTLKTKLDGVENNATADQTDTEIETAYNNQVSEVTQTEAEAGTLTTVKRWTPQRIKQAIESLSPPTTITDNLTSTATDDALSANQGKILKWLIDTINTTLTSDEITLDTFQEIVDYIEANRTTIEALTVSSLTDTNISGLSDNQILKYNNATSKWLNTVLSVTDIPTLTASKISDFDTEVGNHTDVTANTTHRSSTSNPHNVTKSQVWLGNVDNTSDADKPVSTAQQTEIDTKVDKVSGKSLSANDFTDTLKTKLDGVEYNATADQTDTEIKIAYENNSNTNAFTDILKGNIVSNNTHRANTSNPHSVTKAQVWLDNVDNTSDANKPVSTAQQTALNLKTNQSDFKKYFQMQNWKNTISGGGNITWNNNKLSTSQRLIVIPTNANGGYINIKLTNLTVYAWQIVYVDLTDAQLRQGDLTLTQDDFTVETYYYYTEATSQNRFVLWYCNNDTGEFIFSNWKTTSDWKVKVYTQQDTRSWCPPTQGANTDINKQTIILTKKSLVRYDCETIWIYSARFDAYLYVDWVNKTWDWASQFLSSANSSSWKPVNRSWVWELWPWTHTFSYRCNRSNVIWCQSSWGLGRVTVYNS